MRRGRRLGLGLGSGLGCVGVGLLRADKQVSRSDKSHPGIRERLAIRTHGLQVSFFLCAYIYIYMCISVYNYVNFYMYVCIHVRVHICMSALTVCMSAHNNNIWVHM